VMKVLLSLASAHGCSLYSLCPVLPSPTHFEMMSDSFEVMSRIKSMAFLSHYNPGSSFIHESLQVHFY
jgi:hypothetical protein